MGELSCGYAVFLFDSAYEALGEAIAPFVVQGPGGRQICCQVVDTGGAFLEMTVDGVADTGEAVQVEVIVPIGMVRMIVSTRGPASFGFTVSRDGAPRGLPVVGPDAPLPHAPPAAVPTSAGGSGTDAGADARQPPEG